MKPQKEWPASSVEMRAISALVPYAKNSRTHSEAQVDQLVASMREWGWTNPVLIDEEGMIIAGHGRVLAAQKLGLSDAPVMTARGWSASQKQAYVIADNKLALNAGWDMDKLAVEIGDLQGAGFDLSLVGFSRDELLALTTGTDGLTDPDEVPEPEAIAATQLGDVWLLGPHRLVCGDSTEKAAVEACVGQEKPHLMVTDPPYGVEYDANWRNERARTSKGMGNRAIGAGAVGKVANDDRADWRASWALSPCDVVYVWCASLHSHEVAESLIASGYDLRSLIIWDKTRLIIGRSDYHWQHEPCWYAVRKGARGHWAGDRKQTTVWAIAHQKSETGHSTQKPVECMRRPMKNNSKAGDAVYEPFSGSGTTIIAGEQTGRRVFAIELNPVYVDVAVKRWQNFTGKTAKLQATGQTFEEVLHARAQAAA